MSLPGAPMAVDDLVCENATCMQGSTESHHDKEESAAFEQTIRASIYVPSIRRGEHMHACCVRSKADFLEPEIKIISPAQCQESWQVSVERNCGSHVLSVLHVDPAIDSRVGRRKKPRPKPGLKAVRHRLVRRCD